ncbi:MAG: hypothetical protein KA479_11300 [Saprospiraceae bacterium]|nr:hypothetical protein [Saprospiraceae bacterium]
MSVKSFTLFLSTLIGSAGLLLFSGCDKAEEAPAWLVIENYTVDVLPGQGTADHQITEVYAYTPSRFLGVFPIPGRIPILETGATQIDLFPGIRANGIKASPDIYPFLSRYRQTIDLIGGHVDTVTPVFVYDPIAQIRFVEDFEGGIKTFGELINGKMLEIATDDVFEGTASGRITLDTLNQLFEIATISYTDLPLNGTPIYLEVNYKNDVPFVFGISGSSSILPSYRQFAVGLNPRDTWNKVYISLTNTINTAQLENTKIIVFAALPTNYTGGEAHIWIDNIKLIHQ